jgi:protein-S-isoprenylcysteine O-methyltransferase Ste14
MIVLRQLLSVLLLPFVVVVVVPLWLISSQAALDTRWPSDTAASWSARLLGAVIFAIGFSLFVWCVVLFTRVGRGTLAPWDPTRRLVAVGPYRHVRNPMISGVAAMLIGEATMFGSRVIAGWAVVFIAINHTYFLLSEEPGLRQRFGDEYETYQRSVPRWIPRWSTDPST